MTVIGKAPHSSSAPAQHTAPTTPPPAPVQAKVTRSPQLTDEMLKDTPCPFIRSALKADLLKYDGKTAPIARLKEILGSDFGRVPAFFARVNHRAEGDNHSVFTRKVYDPLHLAHSKGDHAGDTGMLGAQGFDRAAFARVVAHSSDRKTMTAADFSRAIVQANRRDAQANAVVDVSKSAGEFALLLEAFGHVEGGEKRISIEDMRLLFERNEFPANWEQSIKQASAAGWAALTLKMGTTGILNHGTLAPISNTAQMANAARMSMGATGAAFDGASYAVDDGSQRVPAASADALAGAMNGLCPAQCGMSTKGNSVTKAEDAERLHS